MTWRVAYSLDVLLEEVNAAAPRRSKISDGSIGDAAHASRSSDHNPWVRKGGVGVVRARDFTHDPAEGCDAGALAEAVRLLALEGHPALAAGAYVIWDRRIASATYGWVWRYYGGSNPHTQHCHVSVTTDPDGFDSRARWDVMDNHHQEDDMPYTDWPEKDRNALVTDVVNGILRRDMIGRKGTLRVNQALRRAADTRRLIRRLEKKVDRLLAGGDASPRR